MVGALLASKPLIFSTFEGFLTNNQLNTICNNWKFKGFLTSKAPTNIDKHVGEESLALDLFSGNMLQAWEFLPALKIKNLLESVRPIHELRCWISEGLTQADSDFWGLKFAGP